CVRVHDYAMYYFDSW
nr:immunoglobulin heavy chain junction region [Macaca mulatta]MOX60710.1 immunoglobulin heavy chain junction region [Macaca mulatta]MOX61067.1 immunoglobulin heavy chain junction region [Macaca mulatta]MOX61684.1 immunoglobulin heavy chain junction region [Macaca mulatta]MOX61730.1 immunoglobulin heavy chain junction region [Macaca mulatta]